MPVDTQTAFDAIAEALAQEKPKIAKAWLDHSKPKEAKP